MAQAYVLDLNVLRRPFLVEKIAQYPKARLIIPDTALVEMSKANWQVNFRNSFASLIPHVDRCYLAVSVEDAKRIERETYQPINGRFVQKTHTNMLRGLISGSQDGLRDPATYEIMRNFDGSIHSDLLKNDLNAFERRQELEQIAATIKEGLESLELLEACKNPQTGHAKRLICTIGLGESLYRSIMMKAGVPPLMIEELLVRQSLTLRWCLLLVHHALNWQIAGGLKSAKDSTVLNDVLDQDYILTASYYSGIWSMEKKVNNSLKDLNVMLNIQREIRNFGMDA